MEVPFAVHLWDGTRHRLGGPGAPAFALVVRDARAGWRLLLRPTALAFGEAFVGGRVTIEGDLFAAMRALHQLPDRPWGARVHVGRRWRRRRARRPAAAIAHHYDVSNDFYGLFLDRRMVYTCAYFRDADADLDRAQEDKLDLVCRKLALRAGERFLDLGCGWGALVLWAAAHHGVRAHGVTLSAAQAAWARAEIERQGLGDRASVEHGDWRDVEGGGRFEKIAAVGLLEHVGVASHLAFFRRVRRLLAPGGRFLGHGITNRHGERWSSASEFLERYVFPGAAIPSVGRVQTAMEEAGFEIDDVENLRPHYARTTRLWVERLAAREAEARRLVGDRTYRTWLGYLAAASVAFEAGWIAVHQVVAEPAGAHRAGDDAHRRRRPAA